MGLDVTAFSKVKRLRDLDGDGDYNLDECFLPGNEGPVFSTRAADVPGGVYSYTAKLAVFSRSYGTYSHWRDALAKLAGYAAHPTEQDSAHIHSRTAWEAEEGPFWELINFTDCDGTLGTTVCQKLLTDFDAFAERAELALDGWVRDVYRSFHAAFRLAADGGAVKFH